jgi:hypothetical protein
MREDEIVALLKKAREIVDQADLPEDLRSSGLETAVALLRADLLPSDQPRPRELPAPRVTTNEPVTGESGLERLGASLQVDVAAIENVFALSSEGLQVIVGPSRLPQSRRAAMRDLVLLTCVGRQLGGWDAPAAGTPLEAAKAVCEHYGPRFFDPNNFMNAISDLGDSLRKIGERGAIRLLLTPTGRTNGRSLVTRLVTDASA